jgi:hypothetical protein
MENKSVRTIRKGLIFSPCALSIPSFSTLRLAGLFPASRIFSFFHVSSTLVSVIPLFETVSLNTSEATLTSNISWSSTSSISDLDFDSSDMCRITDEKNKGLSDLAQGPV